MGMFDSLYVECACGKQVEFQSKAGPCILNNYTIKDVPKAIAADLIGESDQCQACGATITIRGAVSLMVDVTRARSEDEKG